MDDQNLFDRLLLQAEIKASNIRQYVIPKKRLEIEKLKAEIDRMELYAQTIEDSCQRSRAGDETAMIELVKHAFPKKET